MNILFVTQTDPREVGFGGQQRTHALWKGLGSIPGATVRTVVPVSRVEQVSVDETCGIYRQCYDRRYSLGWFLERLLRRLIPYCGWSYGCDWRRFHREFADVDIVVARLIAPVGRFRLDRMRIPLYIDADDIHTIEFDLQTEIVGNGLWRRIQRWILSKKQFFAYSKAKRIWVPSFEHVLYFFRYPFSLLPNIPFPPLPDVSRERGDYNRLVFIGLMASSPNYLAIDNFLKEYWHRLKKDFPKLSLDVIGSGLPQKFLKEWTGYEGVSIRGYVSDIHEAYAQSLALITPMIIGAGTCIKVLEALRMGRPVISTAQGLRGIPIGDRLGVNGVFQYDSYEELSSAISYLGNLGEDRRVEMAQQAMTFVKSQYSQQVVDDVLRVDVVDLKMNRKSSDNEVS